MWLWSAVTLRGRVCLDALRASASAGYGKRIQVKHLRVLCRLEPKPRDLYKLPERAAPRTICSPSKLPRKCMYTLFG